MKTLTVIILLNYSLVLINISNAQNAILYHSSDVYQVKKDSTIRRIINMPIFPYLIIKYNNKNREKVSKSNIWGYIDKNSLVYRQYKNDFFQLLNMGDSIIYINKYVMHMNKSSRVVQDYYYSKSLDSPIYKVNKN